MHMAHAAAAVAINALKASGVVVRIEPDEFRDLLRRASASSSVVVYAQGGLFSGRHQYLLSYKGLAFFTRCGEPIALPGGIELVQARKIWVPS